MEDFYAKEIEPTERKYKLLKKGNELLIRERILNQKCVFFLSKKPVVLPGSKKSIPLPGLLADLLRFYQGLKNLYLNLYSLKKLT